jgi:hypothetical protein
VRVTIEFRGGLVLEGEVSAVNPSLSAWASAGVFKLGNGQSVAIASHTVPRSINRFQQFNMKTAAALPDNVCRAPWTEALAVPAGCRLVSDEACNWTVDCGQPPGQHPGDAPQWRRAS